MSIVETFIPLAFSDVADSFIKISTGLVQLATSDHKDLDRYLYKVAETLEKLRVSCHLFYFHDRYIVL